MTDYEILMIVPRYNPINKKCYQYFFPINIGYIVAALKDAGYFVDCLNLNHLGGSANNIIKEWLDRKKYDFVCVGNNVLGYEFTKKIIQTAKSHPSNPKVILGGTIITSEPFLIFNELRPDFGVIDEGEGTVVELLKYLKENKPLKEVNGLMYWENGKAIFNEKRMPLDINSISFPDLDALGFEEYLDNSIPNYSYMHSVFDNPRVYYIVGSRSCPYKCTFCWHYDNKYRQRSVENIMKELNERVKKYRINRIYILDECFSLDKKRLTEFCRRISELRKELPWELRWVNALRVSDVDSEVLKMIKESGCDIISYGFESYSRVVLESMKKMITPEQIDKAIKETFKNNIAIQANFIFGDIAETKETAQETLNYWKENCEGQAHLAFIMPFPDSEIYRSCLEKGIIKDKLEFIKKIEGEFVMNMTNQMTDKEFNQLKKDILGALAKYRKIVKPLVLKKTGNKRYELKVKCPYCGQIVEYKNFLIENRLSYILYVMCKNCSKKFHIGGNVMLFLHKNYDKLKKFKDMKDRILGHIGEAVQ